MTVGQQCHQLAPAPPCFAEVRSGRTRWPRVRPHGASGAGRGRARSPVARQIRGGQILGAAELPHLTAATRSPHRVTPGMRLALPALSPGVHCASGTVPPEWQRLCPRGRSSPVWCSQKPSSSGVLGYRTEKTSRGAPGYFYRFPVTRPPVAAVPWGVSRVPVPCGGLQLPGEALGAWKGVMVLSWIMQWENDAFWYMC